MKRNYRHDHHIWLLNIISESLKSQKTSDSFTSLFIVYVHEIADINLNISYVAGDELYVKVFHLIEKGLRRHDTIIPLGNSKIAIILNGIRNEGHAVLAAQKIMRSVDKPFSIQGMELDTHITIGIGLLKESGSESMELLQTAEIALKTALEKGASYELLSQKEAINSEKKSFELNKELVKALDNNEYFLCYQPKYSLENRKTVGVEVLLRWKHKKYGLISPEIFIPMLEKNRLINEVTNYVLNTAMRKHIELVESDIDISISINFSPFVLYQPNIESFIRDAIMIWGINPSKLIIEITESALMQDNVDVIKLLKCIKDLGVQISIDDFGTGYSSLAYFKHIPADEIKIDKSFIKTLSHDKANYNLVRMMIDLAHQFDHSIVAEGVEDEETFNVLKDLGCDVVQGYFISKPMEFDQLINWLRTTDNSYKGQYLNC